MQTYLPFTTYLKLTQAEKNKARAIKAAATKKRNRELKEQEEGALQPLKYPLANAATRQPKPAKKAGVLKIVKSPETLQPPDRSRKARQANLKLTEKE